MCLSRAQFWAQSGKVFGRKERSPENEIGEWEMRKIHRPGSLKIVNWRRVKKKLDFPEVVW
jgi:hypothetical protein